MDSEFGNEGFVTGVIDGFDVFYCQGFTFQADGNTDRLPFRKRSGL